MIKIESPAFPTIYVDLPTLEYFYLHRALLAGMNLKGTLFRKTNLRSANLEGSDLSYSD